MNWNGYLILKSLILVISIVSGITWAKDRGSSSSSSREQKSAISNSFDSDDSDSSSVMLSPAEMDAIDLQSKRPLSRAKDLGGNEWRLDGIIFRTEDDWIIWLNGDMYTPNQQPVELTIVKVSPAYVDVMLKIQGNDKSYRIVLNQQVSISN